MLLIDKDMLISKKYIKKTFMNYGIQMSEVALDAVCQKLKSDIHNYAMNAKDLGFKRLIKDKVPIIIGEFSNES
tara:strand:+ start:167 stop:388 length:222 start_codon:yes stop_codon:yes gene_type:complete